MKVNIENASAIRDPSMKPWLLDELVRNLKEMRDRSNAGDMQAAVTEFFEVFRFNDGVGVAALAAQPGSVWQPVGFISEKQLAMIDDPEGEHGRYIPMRKTPAGNFTFALYAAAPTEAKPAQDAVDAWQPISTAPRDGTNILLRWGIDGVSQAKYVPGLPHPWKFIDTNDGVTWLVNHCIDGLGGPSHWMPMPSAIRAAISAKKVGAA